LLTGISPAELPQDDEARIVFRDRTSASNHLVQWIQQLVEPTVKQRYQSARLALASLRKESKVRADSSWIKPHPSQEATLSRYRRQSFPPDNSNIQVDKNSSHLSITIPSYVWIVVFCWGAIASIALYFGGLSSGLLDILTSGGCISLLLSGVALYAIYAVLHLTLNGLTTKRLELDVSECHLSSHVY
jgi:hypothetical protein